MKCEMCHDKDAETVLKGTDGDELYVCGECARREGVRRQKKSQRTRRERTDQQPGVAISISGPISGDSPPPFIEAIMNAVNDMVGDIEKARRERDSRREPEFVAFPSGAYPAAFRMRGALHLEGLFLVGEAEAAKRALSAMKMRLSGTSVDGISDAGHVYGVGYTGAEDRARRVVEDLVAQERNARARLRGEMSRVYADSVCRALAVLKNCRLLSSGELFDLLSPLRLAAADGLLDGVTLKELDRRMDRVDLSSREDDMDAAERDRLDAERADEANEMYEDVVLSERAEELFRWA